MEIKTQKKQTGQKTERLSRMILPHPDNQAGMG
jgi:hypothetical protein